MGSKSNSGRRIVRTKRQTKAQKEAAEKAALRQRVDDLWLATVGDHWENEESGEPWPEQFIDFCEALKLAFCIREREDEDVEGNEYLWASWNLRRFHNPESATDQLFDHGVRA